MLLCAKVSLIMMQYDLITTLSALRDLRQASHITSFLASDNDAFAVVLTPDKYIKSLEK